MSRRRETLSPNHSDLRLDTHSKPVSVVREMPHTDCSKLQTNRDQEVRIESGFLKAHSCVGESYLSSKWEMSVGQATNIMLYFKILIANEITRQKTLKQYKKERNIQTGKKVTTNNRPMTMTSILVQNQELVMRSCRQLIRSHTFHPTSFIIP